ncbi:MAG: hypothetical protein J6Q54_00055, partial [Oscillospiraceae bacterium]|nr:hypothetical protein [Oscillospiraceae bacterium]
QSGTGYYVGGLVGWLSDDAVNNVFTGTVTVGEGVTAGALFGCVDNIISPDSADLNNTATFTPVIERNYYLTGDTAVGEAAADLDTTGYGTLYTYDTATKFKNKLNDGLTAVNEIIDGHRGYLSTSQWAELVVALDGYSIAANDWVVTSGKPSHKMHPLSKTCYCKTCQVSHHSYDAKGSCVYCGTYEAPTGTGSKKDPYKIGNLGQLYSYANTIKRAVDNGYGELIADIVVNENLLKEDGTLNGNPEDFLVWTPMGTREKPFQWAFNGNGHTITGLYVDGDTQYVGLFGYLSKDQVYIENLGIVDSYFAGDRYVGAVTGYSEYCGFRNCYSENCVIRGDRYVGGITSYALWNVQNCYSNSTLIANREVGGISYRPGSYFMENCLFMGQIICEEDAYAINSSNTYVRNCYYLDSCGANGTTSGGDYAVTAQQLASGEVAYKLGEAYGQNIDNGKEKQAYPVLGGAKVYAVLGCDNLNPSGYTNTEGKTGGHSGEYGENGICTRCEAYEPADLVDDYYQIASAGTLFWFAQQVNGGTLSINAKLTADIDLEERPWTPIGRTGGDGGKSFKGIFDGNGKTIQGMNVASSGRGNGFIGEVRGGTVKNFTIYGEVTLSSIDHPYTAGVIGSATGDAVVSGITSYVNVTLKEGSHGVNWVGGLIGYVNANTLVENCVWYGTLDLDVYRAQDGVGGLIGKANAQFTGTIRNCAAYGTIRTAYKSGSYTNSG